MPLSPAHYQISPPAMVRLGTNPLVTRVLTTQRNPAVSWTRVRTQLSPLPPTTVGLSALSFANRECLQPASKSSSALTMMASDRAIYKAAMRTPSGTIIICSFLHPFLLVLYPRCYYCIMRQYFVVELHSTPSVSCPNPTTTTTADMNRAI